MGAIDGKDVQQVFEQLLTATRDAGVCEYALRTARLKLEAAQSDLDDAKARVERAQQELTRLAHRQAGIVEEPEEPRTRNEFIPVRR